MTVDQPTNTLRDESRLIPWWSYALAVCFFGAIQVLVFMVSKSDPRPQPLAFTIMYSILLGMFMAFQMLLIGYVTRDAKRRGMNPLVWLLVLISLLMTGVGFIVYFLFRSPITTKCSRCSANLSPDDNFCPKCRYQIKPVCVHCNRALRPTDSFCANCGAAAPTLEGVVAIR